MVSHGMSKDENESLKLLDLVEDCTRYPPSLQVTQLMQPARATVMTVPVYCAAKSSGAAGCDVVMLATVHGGDGTVKGQGQIPYVALRHCRLTARLGYMSYRIAECFPYSHRRTAPHSKPLEGLCYRHIL